MMFVKKIWKNRFSEFPGRRKLTDVSNGKESIVDVVRHEGTIYEVGDAFSAPAMNDLEERMSKKTSTTVFGDGIITETFTNGDVQITEFGDNVITETYTESKSGNIMVVTTTFNEDGSITETVSYPKETT